MDRGLFDFCDGFKFGVAHSRDASIRASNQIAAVSLIHDHSGDHRSICELELLDDLRESGLAEEKGNGNSNAPGGQ